MSPSITLITTSLVPGTILRPTQVTARSGGPSCRHQRSLPPPPSLPSNISQPGRLPRRLTLSCREHSRNSQALIHRRRLFPHRLRSLPYRYHLRQCHQLPCRVQQQLERDTVAKEYNSSRLTRTRADAASGSGLAPG